MIKIKMKKIKTKIYQSSIINYKSSLGFTLVELLIVIAIIGILSALLMANFIGVRQRARDAQRKADLRQMQAAFEIYRSDTSSYPTTMPACNSPLVNLTTTYMAKMPCDLTTTYNGGKYYFSGSTTSYTLVACLENTGDASAETTSTAPSPAPAGNCASGKYYVLTNP